MRVYTKFGDKGNTSLLTGTVVPKYHLRIEAYGTIDELNAHVGLLRSQAMDEQTKKCLITIQDNLFTIASHLARDKDDERYKLPDLPADIVSNIEKEIDRMDDALPPLKNFIHPGGHNVVSFCHITRTVARRAERRVVQLANEAPVEERFVVYLNRLSDYFFVLSRKLTQDTHSEEIPWRPQK